MPGKITEEKRSGVYVGPPEEKPTNKNAYGWNYRLPKAIHYLYGCTNCEWKGTICPMGFYRKNQTHFEGICRRRKLFLVALLPYGKRYTGGVQEYRRDINLALENIQFLKYLHKITLLEEKIKEMEEKNESEEKIQKLKRDLDNLFQKKVILLKELLHYDDKHIDRITARKLDIKQDKTITLRQIHSIMGADEEIIKIEENEEDEEVGLQQTNY